MTLWAAANLRTPGKLEEGETLCGGEAPYGLVCEICYWGEQRTHANKEDKSTRRAYLKGVVDKGNGGSDAAFGGLGGGQSKGPDLVFAPDRLQPSPTVCHLSYSNVTPM